MQGMSARVAFTMVIAALILPPALVTVPEMARTIRGSRELLAVPRSERRAVVLGSWVRASAGIAARYSPYASIDLVLAEPHAAELAPFVAAELYPRPTWCFDGWDGWRARVAAPFIYDARAVNAARPPRRYADAVVVIDTRRDPPLEVVEPPGTQ